MSLYRNYATDAEKEISGVEIQFEPNDDGTVPTFVVSRLGETNKEYMKALRIATKPVQRLIDMKQLPEAQDAAIFLDVFVSSILKGWSNVQDETNTVIPFSKGNALKLFTELPDLFKLLQKQASDAALFRKAVLEDEAKN